MQKLSKVTKTADIEIKSVYGQSIFDFYSQFKKILLQQANGNELSQFFSEPVVNHVRGEVTWISSVKGAEKSIAEMTPAERQMVGEKIKVFSRMVKDTADHLVQTSGPKSLGAEALRNALVTPNLLESVFLVGDKLVLSQWGCVPYGAITQDYDLVGQGKVLIPDTPEPVPEPKVILEPVPEPKVPDAQPVVLDTAVPVTSEPDEPKPPIIKPLTPPEPPIIESPTVIPVEPSFTEWLWRWLVILLLSLILFFGLLSKGCTNFVLMPSDSEEQLRADINNLWIKVQEKTATCFPNSQKPPPIDDEKKDPTERQEKNDDPPDLKTGIENKDLKAFSGDWRLISNLHIEGTNEKIIFYLHFDANGKGTLRMKGVNGTSCTSGAQAKLLTNNSFDINMDKCKPLPQELAQCTLSSTPNQAECKLTPCTNSSNGSNVCDTTFQRN